MKLISFIYHYVSYIILDVSIGEKVSNINNKIRWERGTPAHPILGELDMNIENGQKNVGKDAVALLPHIHEVEYRIADARRAQSEAIKRMVIGSISAIDRRFLNR